MWVAYVKMQTSDCSQVEMVKMALPLTQCTLAGQSRTGQLSSLGRTDPFRSVAVACVTWFKQGTYCLTEGPTMKPPTIPIRVFVWHGNWCKCFFVVGRQH